MGSNRSLCLRRFDYFSIALQSLKEFYEDQRGKFESHTELEMRVYHRLIHIRDQKERHDDIPRHILDDPVFTLITKFRQHVQEKSAPITKVSQLSVGDDGMAIFAQLAHVLQEQNNTVMVYLIACLLERTFGKGAIQDDLELIRGDLSISNIIDGVSCPQSVLQDEPEEEEFIEEIDNDENSQTSVEHVEQDELPLPPTSEPTPSQYPSVFGGHTASPFGVTPRLDTAPPKNAFTALVSTPSPFAAGPAFGGASSMSVFGGGQHPSAFVRPASSPFSLPPGNPLESVVQPLHLDGLVPPQTSPSFFPPASAIQPTPLTTKSEASFNLSASEPALEPPQVQQPLSETVPSPLNSVLNPDAPTFIPLKPSPSVPPVPSSTLPSDTQPVPIPAFTAPTFLASPIPRSTGPSLPLSVPLDEPQTTPAARLVEKRQTLWDIPGTSGPRRPPRINTDLTSDGITPSPKVPPLLKRAEPISLPPTTPHTPLSSHPSLKGNKSLKGFPSIQNIQTPAGILSPLNLTPSINAREFSFTIPAFQQPETPAAVGESNGIATEETRVEDCKAKKEGSGWITDAKERAIRFKRRGVLVKNCFSRWRLRLMEQVEYLEAVKKSDEYKKKLQLERELSASISVSSSGGDRKRRISGMSPDSAQRKRAKKRSFAKYAPPRTEDDLIRRLREVCVNCGAPKSLPCNLLSRVAEP